jgi:hypothetical protein
MREAKQELEDKYQCAAIDSSILQGEKQLLQLQLETLLWILEQQPGKDALAKMLDDKFATEQKVDATASHACLCTTSRMM